MIGLKIDNELDWRWREIFWVGWVLFAMLCGLSIGIILIFILKLYTFLCVK